MPPQLPRLAPATAICAQLAICWPQAAALHRWALAHTLADEHARAASFLRPEDGLRHLLGRALLRQLAARCAGADPRQPLAVPQAGGKPYFAGQAFDASISHGGDQVWVALARGARVGVDVERRDALTDAGEVITSLHPAEAAALAATAPAAPAVATVRCWTRKEAVAKATGLGLSLPLDAYVVATGEAAAHWLLQPPPQAPGPWTCLDLPAGPDHLAALALHGRCTTVYWLELHWTGQGPP